jgi:hypothetical protein
LAGVPLLLDVLHAASDSVAMVINKIKKNLCKGASIGN